MRSILLVVLVGYLSFQTTAGFTSSSTLHQATTRVGSGGGSPWGRRHDVSWRPSSYNENNGLHIQRPYSGSRSLKVKTALCAVPTPLVALASSPAGAILILATIILIHESGHYIAARSFGIEVEEFAIGFGPKLVGFSALGNEFNLRLVPLGGYVRFPENYNATEYEEMQRQSFEDAKARKAAKVQIKPTLGFRVANALTLGALEKKNKEAQVQTIEERVEAYNKLPWWGKLRAIQKKQAEEAEELGVEKISIPYDDNPNLLQNRPWQQRAVVISAGVVFNLLLSFFIYFGQIGGPNGLPSPVFDQGVKIAAIPQRTAAASGILKPGDVVLQINGMQLTKSPSPSIMEAQGAMNDLIAAIRATPAGGDIELSILRDGGEYAETVRIQPKRAMTGDGEQVRAGPQTIGVILTPNTMPNNVLRSDNPLEAAKMAFQYTYTLTMDTAQGISQVFTQFLVGGGTSGSGGGGGGGVSGPIGLIRAGSEVVATRDVQTILLFAAAISVNLGVINAFPLPVLDGGQLVFVLAEALTARKIDQRVQERISGFAALFLILLTVSATLGDISGLFGL
ncbi:hypothetical protein ACA910_020009 [Epithemia clementina (nom. ined.)]